MIVGNGGVKRPKLKSSLLSVSNFAGSALPGELLTIERLTKTISPRLAISQNVSPKFISSQQRHCHSVLSKVNFTNFEQILVDTIISNVL